MCQLIAAICIWDPMTEMIWPIHNRRKSRCRSEENAVGRSSALTVDEKSLDSRSGICRRAFFTYRRGGCQKQNALVYLSEVLSGMRGSASLIQSGTKPR